MRDMNFEKLDAAGKKIKERLDAIVERNRLAAVVRGPMPAVITRVQRFHRMQIVVQAPDAAVLRELFTSLREQPAVRPAIKVAIDMDPVNLL
jgi:primosomal protein N'